MQKEIQWLEIWRELAELQDHSFKKETAENGGDPWRKRAKIFDADVTRRWEAPDSSRSFIAAQLEANPEWTALDIGGGVGAWTLFMAQRARHVTIVEPSPAMREFLHKNLEQSGIHNVDVMQEKWPEAQTGMHDLTLCSHAMYGFADFAAFIESVTAVTRRLCVLILRAPVPEDLLSVAARHIRGLPFDSPNFQVAYNCLLQMGLFPNVLMEDTGLWPSWTSASLEEALAKAQARLHLPPDSEHSPYLYDLLARNLVRTEDGYVWPRSIRSALVYWTMPAR